MPDMKKKYNEEVKPALMQKLGLKNVMEIPKLTKIVISTGISTKMEKDALSEARMHITALAGQCPVACKSKKNVANFKLRVGQTVGLMVTLRGEKMYQFLDRLVHNAFPRVRDFHGAPKKGFDHVGNYNLGIPDVSIFTEIDLDKIKYPLGINVTFVTTAKTDAAAKELLAMLEFPFAK